MEFNLGKQALNGAGQRGQALALHEYLEPRRVGTYPVDPVPAVL